MQKLLRRHIPIILATSVLFSAIPCQAKAVQTSAAAAVLMDVDSGRVLYEQNADAKMRIASTTKILTALVAVENGDLSDVVTVSSNAAATEGSAMYLAAGEKLSLETLLYGLLLCSGNDAAVAIAEHVGGSVEGFAEMMNARAREIGMEHSSFANPNGLDHASHYSTARDMALLACEAVDHEILVRMVSTKRVSIDGRTMTNHNKLLGLMEGCIGLKTGYTKAAGRTLVSCAQRNGQRLVAVTLQDGNDWGDHQALYEYGFSNWPRLYCAMPGQKLQNVSVADAQAAKTPYVAADYFSWPVREGETVKATIQWTASAPLPPRVGEKVGEAIFSLNETEIGRVSLLCSKDVSAGEIPAMAILKNGLSG